MQGVTDAAKCIQDPHNAWQVLLAQAVMSKPKASHMNQTIVFSGSSKACRLYVLA